MKKTNTLFYRLCRYPRTTALSIGLVLLLSGLFCYLLGLLYPQFMLFDRVSSSLGLQAPKKYDFYSGQITGAYHSIGKAIEGKLGRDSIKNQATSGGSENGMKLTIQKNSFGLIQEELINRDDQLRKNVNVVAPLFMERMHIFYRKNIFNCLDKTVQLSANTDSCILQRISDSVVNINMGLVGTGTRIVASYLMAVVEQQIILRLKNKNIRFKQLNEGFSTSAIKMKEDKIKRDTTAPDILFYLVADPIKYIKNLLDSTNYDLMSIDPSLVVLMNREFDLKLRGADFKDKYDSSRDFISTLGTLTFLIASKSINQRVSKQLLKRINVNKKAIHSDMVNWPANDSSFALNEFGFYNTFSDEYEVLTKTRLKEILIFLFSVLTLFFPVFKSVFGCRYTWQRWNINKRIDEIAEVHKKTGDNSAALLAIARLKEEVINLYGDGLLPETNYAAIINRTDMYFEKFSVKISHSPKKGADAAKGFKTVPSLQGRPAKQQQ